VRGDSLRDLYAKTLAIVGLGLIAGAGAIVDYWPVASPLPEVAGLIDTHAQLPVLVQNLEQQIPAPEMRVVRIATAPQTLPLRQRKLPWPAFGPKPATVKHHPASQSVTPVGTTAPSATVSMIPDAAPPVEIWSQEILMGPQGHQFDMAALAGDPMTVAPSTGLLGGALKKTKESLVKTGVVTGGSIVKTGVVTGGTIADAVKGVFGAFKKVTPF